MKQIIIISTRKIIRINKGKHKQKIIDNVDFHSEWHYSELLPDKNEVINSYKELIEKGYCNVWESTSKRDKRLYGESYSYFLDDIGREIRFADKEFVSFELEEYCQRIDNYTLELLMRKLPAEEMIEYLKDNGLNICPIVRE